MRSPMRSFGEDRILSVLSFGVGMPGSVESGAAGQTHLFQQWVWLRVSLDIFNPDLTQTILVKHQSAPWKHVGKEEQKPWLENLAF
jgi:hypothetical protein